MSHGVKRRRKKKKKRQLLFGIKNKENVGGNALISNHTHSQGFLVWLEEFAGELAEDGEVGEVGGAGRVGGLDEPAEHKLNAAPAGAVEE